MPRSRFWFGSVLHNINNNNVIIIVFNSFDILFKYYYDLRKFHHLCESFVLFVIFVVFCQILLS